MKTFKDVMEGLKVIGAGTTTIALAGAAVEIGKIFSSLIHSVAQSRNPLIYLPFNLKAFSSGTVAVDDLAGADLHSLSFFKPFDIIWLGLTGINNEKKTTKWKQQLTMALGKPRQRPRRRGDQNN
nr:ATP synthase F0 subunit 9, mitochondrial [Tanacetum cinerariifolium]